MRPYGRRYPCLPAIAGKKTIIRSDAVCGKVTANDHDLLHLINYRPDGNGIGSRALLAL